MPDRTTPEDLIALLTRGEVVVFAQERAAKAWRTRYDRAQRQAANNGGPAAWAPARAISWSQWTSGLWNSLVLEGVETRLLLNPAQEHHVWREVVGARATDSLAPPDALASLAMEAWSLACRFGAVEAMARAANTPDSRTFAEWAAVFQRRCARGEMLSAALLEDALSVHVEAGRLRLEAELTLVGFLDATPAQENLLATFEQHGASVRRLEVVRAGETTHAMAVAKTEADEVTAAARWVRRFLETRGPVSSVAMIVPGLAAERAELESVLRRELAPELESIDADVSSAPWEMSAGEPLSGVAMVQAAVSIVDWLRGPMPFDRISALLLSPYVGDTADRTRAAVFDAEVLRRAKPLRPEADAGRLLSMGSAVAPAAPAWIAAFDAFRKGLALENSRSYAEWMGVFRAALKACDWPGTRQRTAIEFAAMQAFDAVMDTVATLDFDGARVGLRDAASALQRLVQQTATQGPATGAPVQVMSLEESAGMAFDAAVMLRATDAQWPAREKANPLLAWGVQKSLGMPGTDAAAATTLALRRGEDLLARCGEVLLVRAEANADGSLRPSPLLAKLGLVTVALNEAESPAASVVMEAAEDEAPLPALPSPYVRGGASVLRAQAACGFRAFAEFRLHAHELDAFAIGMDAPESGRRVHDALGAFWSEVRTLRALKAMTDDERAVALRRAVETSMMRHLRSLEIRPAAWDASFVEMQKERLFVLLQEWLAAEIERSPFEVVQTEGGDRVTLGPLELDLRFDRVDRLGDEGREFVLVDYKTGAAGHPKDWEGDRPDDPQLPLYALQFEPETLHGIAFGKVRAGEMKWLGRASREDILPKARNVVADLEELAEEWRAVLTQLAYDFAEGRADVAPKEYPKTCERCSIRLLCRVSPEAMRELPDGLRDSDEDEAEEWDG